jgi:hypothetical protein
VTEPLRAANCSGFYGDRLSAAREMVEGGPIDVLTGDYLAELTMFLLWKAREKDPEAGYATTFLRQMDDVLATALARRIKIVVNAGGLNPAGLAAKLRDLASRRRLDLKVAHLEGDDLRRRLPDLLAAGHRFEHLDTGRPLAELGATPVTANAYLGAWGIVAALEAGADVVICPRVADASLVVGPAAWRFGWRRDDWDRLAGATVAGHVLECGTQATGGNYPFLSELPDLRPPGFPIAEIHEDGSSVITTHPDTGGLVSVGTVTAQLVYEIAEPAYLTPDVVARFDTIRIEADGADRVRLSGVEGGPAPDHLKVAINYPGGYRNAMILVLTGPDIEAKAERARRQLFAALGGEERFAAVDVQLLRADRPDPGTNEAASALLRITVKDADSVRVGRAFSGAVVEMALASYPGFYATTPPGEASAYAVFWPARLPAELVETVVVLPDGSRRTIPHARPTAAPTTISAPAIALPTPPGGPTRRLPLGTVFGARSGDKGGNANLGVWARSPAAYAWLRTFLTADRLKSLLPETAPLTVRRFELPNLLALNFVIVGLLGEGALSSTRLDPQAKSLGEWLRARVVELPEALLADEPKSIR